MKSVFPAVSQLVNPGRDVSRLTVVHIENNTQAFYCFCSGNLGSCVVMQTRSGRVVWGLIYLVGESCRESYWICSRLCIVIKKTRCCAEMFEG